MSEAFVNKINNARHALKEVYDHLIGNPGETPVVIGAVNSGSKFGGLNSGSEWWTAPLS